MPYESCCNQRLKKTPEYLRMLELLDATGKLRIVPNTGIDVKFWKNAGGCREFGRSSRGRDLREDAGPHVGDVFTYMDVERLLFDL